MTKIKKPLFIALLILDLSITSFLFIVSVIMLCKLIPADNLAEAIQESSGLIRYLLQHNKLFFGVFVVPLFVLLAVNIIGLVFYVKKTSANENKPTKLDDLSEEQKEALRQELLKDLMKDTQNNKED